MLGKGQFEDAVDMAQKY